MSLSFLISISAYAQTRQISGVVTSTDGPLPGATVMVKGTTTGVVTDPKGAFKLAVPANGTSVISIIG